MTSEEIKEVRKTLGLTQEELAVILGVTKTSVARYEMQEGPKPQGDVERKLAQLCAFVSDSAQREEVKRMRKVGGVASLAAILAIASATFPVAAVAVSGITLRAILASPAALFLGGLLAGGAVATMATTAKPSSTENDETKKGE